MTQLTSITVYFPSNPFKYTISEKPNGGPYNILNAYLTDDGHTVVIVHHNGDEEHFVNTPCSFRYEKTNA